MAEFVVEMKTLGVEKVEAAMRRVLDVTQKTNSQTLAVAKALGVSVNQAYDLGKSLGKTPGELVKIVGRAKELQQTGLNASQSFSVLNKELGVTKNQFEALTKESTVFSKSAGEVQESMQAVGIAAGAVTAGVGGVFVKGTEDFLEFDNALRQTRVILGESEEGMAGLRTEVERLGMVTSKTSQEIAGLTTQLARAGFSAREQMDALFGIVRASEASGDSLSVVGEVIGQTIRVFGLQASESETIADQLVATANNTNTSVGDLGEALSYVGSQAKQANQPVDDTLIALGLLADAGIKGSAGGTAYAEALRRISLASAGANTEFSDLVRGSAKATEAFGVLETEIRGSNGQLLPMTQLLPVLADKFEVLEQADKEVLSDALFGVQGGRAFLTLLGNVGGRLESVSDEVKNAGGVSEASGEQMLTGLGGALELLGGSVETASGKFGAFTAEGLEPLVRQATKVVNLFLGLPPSFQNVIIATTGLVGAISGLIAVMTALELLQLRSKLALIGESVGLAANTVAKLANAAATETLTVAQLKNVVAVGVSSAAWKGFTATLVSFRTAAMAALPALALLAAGLALGDVLKTTGEIRQLNIEVDALGKGSAAVFDSALKVAEGLKNVNEEINAARAKGLPISDALIEKQRQYLALGKKTVEDIEAEIAARTEVMNLILAGKGASDVPGLAGTTKEVQESILNNLRAQQAELGVALRLTQKQVDIGGEVANVTSKTATETAKVADNLKDATSAADKLSVALSAIDLDVTKDQTAAYAELGDDKEALETRLTSIESDALDKRLVQQTKYLDSLASATFETEAERTAAIAETEQEIADIRLEQAKRASELSQEQAERVAEFEKDKREQAEETAAEQQRQAEETAAEQQRQAEETAAKQQQLLEETQALEDALRDSATAKELRDIDLIDAAYQAATDAKVAGYGKVLEVIDDQNDALNQQNKLLDLQIEKLKTQADIATQDIDARIAGLSEAETILGRLASGEAGIAETQLLETRLRELGIAKGITELELLDKQQAAAKARRDVELKALREQQRLEVLQLQNQQAQEQLALKRAVSEARINKTKAEQLVMDQKILQLQNQVALVKAQSELDVARSRGASPAELAALQTAVDAQSQINQLGQQGLQTAQAGVVLATEQVADAKDAVTEYQQIAELQTKNLELSQSFALGQKQAADETERLADALERAALAGDRAKASAVVGVTPKRHGGTVSPGNLYQVNEAGVEAFKPLGGKPQLLNQPANSLFSPFVPGRILTAPQVNQMIPSFGNGGGGTGGGDRQLLAAVNALRADIAARPIQVDMGASTFINEPSPLATQLQIARGRLKAARGLL